MISSFVQLYKQEKFIAATDVNWDPASKSAISDEKLISEL